MSRSTDDGVVPFHFAVAALALGSLQSHLTRLKKMVIGTKASKPQKKTSKPDSVGVCKLASIEPTRSIGTLTTSPSVTLHHITAQHVTK